MDPSITLVELREAIVELGRPDADLGSAINTVIERWAALDTWLSNDGFPPVQWGNLTTKDVVEDIQRELEPDPWGTHASLSALSGAISAGEAVARKLRGDA